MKNPSDKSCGENQNTHILYSVTFPENRSIYDIMWKNLVEPHWLQMTVWRMRIARWIPKPTNTHLEYVILIAFPRQQWLREHAAMFKYTGCFTTCGHCCRRWFPRSLWLKKLIQTCVRFRTVTELWAFSNSRTRPRVNRATEPAGRWCTQLGGLSFALQALFSPPDSPTQMQSVQFPYHTTWNVFKECGGRWGGWVFAWPVYAAWSSYYCVFKNPLSLTLQWLCRHLMFRTVSR